MYQHEIDHLDGVLMTERLDDDQRAEAKRAVRELMLARGDHVAADGPGSLLP
jgi:peptide deformylase